MASQSQEVNGSKTKVNPEEVAHEEEEVLSDEDISSEESEEEEIDDVPVQTIATTRPKRANAGAKMASLLNNSAEKDEFYQKAYGGFTEDADDGDFDKEANEEEDEEIDEDEADESAASQEAATNA